MKYIFLKILKCFKKVLKKSFVNFAKKLKNEGFGKMKILGFSKDQKNQALLRFPRKKNNNARPRRGHAGISGALGR